MEEKNQKAKIFIERLLNLKEVKELELYDDQGVKVSDHTYDVLNIAISSIKEQYKSFKNAKRKINFFAITVSVIIHDISKGTIRKQNQNLSHSQMMKLNPEYIIEESVEILEKIEKETGFYINDDVKKSIYHIVLTHHGKWGKYQPETLEDHIVHRADMESATLHRINPINANDILKLVANGNTLDEVEKILDISSSVIRDRLKRSKKIVKVATNTELLEIYKKRGRVPIGDKFFVLRALETKKLKKLLEHEGFFKLMMNNPLMEYMEDAKIFK